MSDAVGLAVSQGVAVLSLRAPERRNALTLEMAEAVIEACEMIDDDSSVGAVIVGGEGGYFCAGADREVLARAGEDPADPERFEAMGRVYAAFRRIGALEPPTIAAVRGGAVGAGLNLALATDLRVVGVDAQLLSGFLPIGLHPGGGHGWLLSRAVGREAAVGLALFGQRITGEEAADRGLAWTAVPDEHVDDVARELAAVPAADPELSRLTARSLRTVAGPPAVPWDAALELERAAQMWSLRRRTLASDA